VTTVVAKLFHVIEPDFAFFGQKDAVQHAIIRHMVRDLHMPVSVEVCPIVREADGLALSSRNAYLSADERQSALVLYRSVTRVRTLFEANERDSAKLINAARQEFATETAVRLDYFEIVNPDTLEPQSRVEGKTLVAVAAFVGKTRLIDNVVLGA
jgi:pantoate--beta-alanine ligase